MFEGLAALPHKSSLQGLGVANDQVEIEGPTRQHNARLGLCIDLDAVPLRAKLKAIVIDGTMSNLAISEAEALQAGSAIIEGDGPLNLNFDRL